MTARDYAMRLYCTTEPLAPLVEAFCDGAKWMQGHNNDEALALTEGVIDQDERIQRLTLGLRNVLGYARHELRRIDRFKAHGREEWEAIIKFCEDAGIKSSILREGL